MAINGSYGDAQMLEKLTVACMPFGKHSKMYLIDLPLIYLAWFCKIGFPGGELGQLMRVVYDIKAGDMEHLFDNIRTLQASHVADSVAITK